MKPAAEQDPAPGCLERALYCEIDGLEVDVSERDFSPAGFFVQTICPPDADTEVEIFLRSNAGSASVTAIVVTVVSCEAAAAKRAAPGFGALFTDLSEANRCFLERTTEQLQQPVRARAADATARAHTATETDAAQVLADLQRQLKRDSERCAWRVLDISAGASVDDAKRAFLKLAKRHHPHAYARYRSPALSQIATRLFILHKKAYADFCTEATRGNENEQPNAARSAGKRQAAPRASSSAEVTDVGGSTVSTVSTGDATQHAARPSRQGQGKSRG